MIFTNSPITSLVSEAHAFHLLPRTSYIRVCESISVTSVHHLWFPILIFVSLMQVTLSLQRVQLNLTGQCIWGIFMKSFKQPFFINSRSVIAKQLKLYFFYRFHFFKLWSKGLRCKHLWKPHFALFKSPHYVDV